MTVSGPKAQALMAAVLARINPQLPAELVVEMTSHTKWMSLQRVADGDVRGGPLAFTPRNNGRSFAGQGKTMIAGLGSWVPFMAKRYAALDAVETVLGVAYRADGQSPVEVECDVKAKEDGELLRVSYLPPGGTDPADRVHLEPIPMSLL
jgi:hypothetical protein